jgi:Flp pilus assembly protein TadG
MFIMLLGMVGLVIDSGLLLAARRQAQNAADAASTAAATDLLGGKSEDEARATATEFVKVHNGLTNAPDPVVNIPPASGPYQGEPGYVEVIVSNPLQTFLIHLLPGVSQENTVRARAVGGFEPITAGAGVAVLNPFVTGLTVGGQATLRVQGLVIVNSEGKGVDANNLPVGTGENYYAGRAGSNSPAYATKFHVVGGVDWPANFRNIDPASTAPALYCGQIPIPDPLLTLPTPVAGTGNGANTAGGVIDVPRGSPVATNTNLMPYDPLGVNKVLSPGSTGFETSLFAGLPYMVLHPGIYTSIEITGGNVLFKPGIFVIKPNPNTQTALKVTGGNVIAKGIMFYNTGHNYVAATGEPDVNDGDKKPPKWGGTDWDFAEFGTITINAGMEFSPIDLDDPVLYAEYQASGTIPDEMFNGMLFYQRRRDTVGLDIQGSSSEGMLSGTLYAKWAHVKLAGQGTYDAQFVVGSMEITGSGVVTIDYAGKKLGKAPQVFLVE